MESSFPETVEAVLSGYNFPQRIINRAVGIATVQGKAGEIDTRTMRPRNFVPHQTLSHFLDLHGIELYDRALYRICDRLGFEYLKVANARFYLLDDVYIICPINTADFPDTDMPFRLFKTVGEASDLLFMSKDFIRVNSDYRGGDLYKTVQLEWPGYSRRFWVVDPERLTIAAP